MCSAKSFNPDNAAIGGITVGSKIDYVRSIYGEPTEIFKRDDNSITWFYGDSFQIQFVNQIATTVVSSAPNGLTTPNEVSVGMKEKVLRSKFGRPSQSESFKNRSIKTYNLNDFNLIFIIKNKIISEIRIVKVNQ